MWETIREKVHARKSSFEAGIVSALVSFQRIGTPFVRKLSTVTGPYMRFAKQNLEAGARGLTSQLRW